MVERSVELAAQADVADVAAVAGADAGAVAGAVAGDHSLGLAASAVGTAPSPVADYTAGGPADDNTAVAP